MWTRLYNLLPWDTDYFLQYVYLTSDCQSCLIFLGSNMHIIFYLNHINILSFFKSVHTISLATTWTAVWNEIVTKMLHDPHLGLSWISTNSKIKLLETDAVLIVSCFPDSRTVGKGMEKMVYRFRLIINQNSWSNENESKKEYVFVSCRIFLFCLF